DNGVVRRLVCAQAAQQAPDGPGADEYQRRAQGHHQGPQGAKQAESGTGTYVGLCRQRQTEQRIAEKKDAKTFEHESRCLHEQYLGSMTKPASRYGRTASAWRG